MCRNIKTLHNFDPPVTQEEIRSAALQYVRKISGSAKPSRANEAAFLLAVDEIAEVSGRLLSSLVATGPASAESVGGAPAPASASGPAGSAWRAPRLGVATTC